MDFLDPAFDAQISTFQDLLWLYIFQMKPVSQLKISEMFLQTVGNRRKLAILVQESKKF
jgi:hypothetical protein